MFYEESEAFFKRTKDGNGGGEKARIWEDSGTGCDEFCFAPCTSEDLDGVPDRLAEVALCLVCSGKGSLVS